MNPRTSSLATLVLAATGALAVPTAADTPLGTVRVASGLAFPGFVTHAPGDTARIFFTEKAGVIRVMDLASGAISTFLDIQSSVGGGTSAFDERGLLGLAFHPDYASNGYFYVNYTDNASDTQISRFTVLGDPATSNVADSTSEVPILFIDQPQANHNGGWIGFSPVDGYLYIGTGDGGNGCDVGTGHTSGTGNAQDITNNLLGKMLRIDVDGGSPYAIPPTNPFVGVTGDDEIWSYGLRNPYRCCFDRLTGDLYIGDVGQDLREEINFEAAGGPGGVNYGWRCREGAACATSSPSSCPTTTGCLCPAGTPGLTDPISDYTHNPPPPPTAGVCAVTGGNVYRGSCIADLGGHYFFADFCADAVWSFVQSGGAETDYRDRTSELTPSLDGFAITDIVAFGEDAAGEMYVVDQGFGSDGQIFRIVPRATQSVRNAGTNPAAYAASTVELGGTFTATVDRNLTGQSLSVLFAFDQSATIVLAAGQTLLAFDTGSGELFSGSGLAPTSTGGGVDTYSLAVPNNTILCDIDVFSQSILFGSPPFQLTNANDLSIGY